MSNKNVKWECYLGKMINDKWGNFKWNIFGRGIYFFMDGRKYQGDIIDGLSEGKGIFYYKNGDRYEGDFKNYKPNGKGVF